MRKSCVLLLLFGALALACSASPRSEVPLAVAPPCDSVAVLPFDVPKELHDGVKYTLADWTKEIPIALLEDSTIRVARPRQVPVRVDEGEELKVGRRLGVAAVLVGKVTVEDDGARLVIVAELLDTNQGLLMWTRTWTIEDILQKVPQLEQMKTEIIAGVKKRLEREAARQSARK